MNAAPGADSGVAGTADDRPPQVVLIESQGWCAPVDAGLRRDAVAQARAGRAVLMYLIEDACVLARPGSDAALDELRQAGGRLLVDRFSLEQRGLAGIPLAPGARVADMDELAELVVRPDIQVVWH
ncbi:hypothetical protein [Streptomyces alkaliterrae]|uniref:Sulfur reduction protein DsrE n=1 Tax=Streptomyces alkaliterrae TaxID=2213162 RepID=A0A5P0YJJ7_9ACTN|nr:hypothetical protein [Streptomyces alkaliterrae]MBB1258516.1 hypothetical protein [Streptomyces alkaliterrae]MQS00486.1 hypothetical protein [Streptomyces alkaliterrae]